MMTRICTHFIHRVCLGQFFGAFGTHFENKFVLKCKTQSIYCFVVFGAKISCTVTKYNLHETAKGCLKYSLNKCEPAYVPSNVPLCKKVTK
jgi:hypothetical protein